MKIVWIQQTVDWNLIVIFKHHICGKMHIAVPELSHSLIVLAIAWCIENTCIFTGYGQLLAQIKFHGGFHKQKQIIAASSRTINAVIIIVVPVIFAIINVKHC